MANDEVLKMAEALNGPPWSLHLAEMRHMLADIAEREGDHLRGRMDFEGAEAWYALAGGTGRTKCALALLMDTSVPSARAARDALAYLEQEATDDGPTLCLMAGLHRRLWREGGGRRDLEAAIGSYRAASGWLDLDRRNHVLLELARSLEERAFVDADHQRPWPDMGPSGAYAKEALEVRWRLIDRLGGEPSPASPIPDMGFADLRDLAECLACVGNRAAAALTADACAKAAPSDFERSLFTNRLARAASRVPYVNRQAHPAASAPASPKRDGPGVA